MRDRASKRTEPGRKLPQDLRIGDLVTFLTVRRCGSIAGAARELWVTPSQVSKAVARLEEQLKLVLLSRSIRGVTLSNEALRVLPHLEEVVNQLGQMVSPERAPSRRLTVAAPSYLCAMLLPCLAEALPGLRLRGMELPPSVLRVSAVQNIFDVGLTPGQVARLPPSWTSQPVGEIRKALLARPELARRLGPQPVSPERIAEIPFITPVYYGNGEFVSVDDDCPLPRAARRAGHEAQTITAALQLGVKVDQLVFGPLAPARPLIRAGELVEVQVQGWDVREPLHLVCSAERVRAPELRTIVATVQRALD